MTFSIHFGIKTVLSSDYTNFVLTGPRKQCYFLLRISYIILSEEVQNMQELKPIKEGKVREIYDNGNSLIMVATDRISCFDVILHNEVTK